jgi:alanine-synthesizing transaminase
VNKLLRSRLCANHPEQYAIQPALEGPQDHLIEVKSKLRSRRDLTVKWCSETARVSCVAPRGAFYAYPRIDIPEGDDVFVTELIRQKHVTVVHGSGFRPAPGNKPLPHSFPARRKDADRCLLGNCRFHAPALRVVI